MKRMRIPQLTGIALIMLIFISACKKEGATDKSVAKTDNAQETIKKSPAKPLSSEFKSYWYAGEAEITSYDLKQVRYGEIRPGTAVLVYVTEPFLAEKQVKADGNSPDNISVLKLNATKKFLTGIYPYSIMSSSFYPVNDIQQALKVSTSVQEWCGHTYTQLNNRDRFEINAHSYFEKEGDQQLQLEKSPLENEIWNQLKINPDALPTGNIKMIPSFEYLRLGHKPIKAYEANASLKLINETYTYSITYPEHNRTLNINFKATFPYVIEGWTESYPGGFGSSSEILTTSARIIKSIKTPYWRQNKNEDVSLRDSLGI